MLRLAVLCVVVSCGVARAATPSSSGGASVGPTIGVDELTPGMEGYGLTVFVGMKPERFPVKLVAVMHNFLPKQDLILIRCDDPRLAHAGIAQGMSGSPIYFDGRLAGALSYGWGFSKDPIAGVTPIANMLAELARPLRGESTPRAQVEPSTSQLSPAAIPLQVSGLSSAAVAELGEQLAPFHMVPMQAGGGRAKSAKQSPNKDKARFEPGSTIAVELMRGDVSAVGTGTVTAVAGDRVLAFGHPMFNAGEVAIPISTAEIHTFMASLNTSFKLSSPVAEAGTLQQDRQSCIVGDMSKRVPMVPMTITVHVAGRPVETFAVEIARHRFLTGMLASSVLGSAATTAASDVTDATTTIKTRIAVHGEKPIEITEHAFAPDGVSARSLGSTHGIGALTSILFNPFANVTVDRVDVDLDVAYRADVAELTEISVGAETVEPGSRGSLRLVVRPFGKPEETMVVPLEIPMALAGQTIKVSVQSGANVRPDQAPPETLHELLASFGNLYSARSFIVGIETNDEGLTLRGRLVPELPGSVLDSLRPSADARRSDSLRHVDRVVIPTSFVTVGKQELTLRVRDRR